MSQSLTSQESRALNLLGQGIGPEMVASAVGLSVSRISQLLSDAEFADQVAELRYKSLAKHNERDATYDDIEDILAKKFKDLLPFMMKPGEVLKGLQVINALKRRGASAPDAMLQKQEVVQLVMPIQVINQFTVNAANQVIKAGQQELITVQSGRLTELVKRAKEAQNVLTHSPTNESATTS